ncbi:MAG: DUF3015 family protein [Reinekea sp.]
MKQILTFLILFTTAMHAFAERDFATIYKECGLGAMLFPKDPVIAVITNVTWDLGTTAVSSELTSPETCKGNAAAMVAFVLDTHPQLEQDLSTGEGQYLSSMVSLMGCDSVNEPTHALRTSFIEAIEQGYYSATDVEKSKILYDAAMKTSAEFCSI